MPMAFFDPLELSMWDGFCHPGTEAHVGAGGIRVELAASQAARETLWLLGSRWLVPSAGWEQWGWGAAMAP